MAIDKDVLDRLLEGRDPSDVFARDGLLDDLEKALSERILNAELDEHLAGEREALPMSEPPARPSNRRNGTSPETVLTGTSRVRLDVPRDRAGTFDPQLIAKYQRRFPEFDEKIVSMCARGLSTRAIRDHLEELYGIDVSPDLVSAITDAVLDEVTAWQNRPLEPCYPLVFLDAIRVKIRDEGFVRNKAIHIALGIQPDGTREVLGLWIEQTEGAKFWLRVMNELKARGVEDILMAVTDGLKGFPEAIEAVFPDAVVQTCIVHLVRHSLDFISWKDRKAVVPALRAIYRAQDAEGGAQGPVRRVVLPLEGPPIRLTLRGGPLGAEVPRRGAGLAPQLGARRALLRLPRGGPPDRLHDQRHRGAERQASPRRARQGTLPQ